MTIVVGFAATDEGRAALSRAVAEATLRGEGLLVVDSSRPGGTVAGQDDLAEAAEALASTGVDHQMRPRSGTGDAAEDVLTAAFDVTASLIVIGLRRRTPVGKLLLGGNAQRVLLDAPCPVLAVKSAEPVSGSGGGPTG